MRRLALVVAIACWVPPARAADTLTAAPQRSRLAELPDGSSRFGLAVEGGFPEGATASLVVRATPAARFWAGPAWSYVAWGVQGGVAITPWHFAVTPVLAAEAGRYFRADVSFLAKDEGGVPEELEPLLQRMTYSYASLQLGFDVGSQRGLSFGLRAGLSYVSIVTRGTVTVTPEQATDSRVSFSDPKLRGTVPSLKLGVTYFF
jgi:hypothetical protein